MNFFDLLKNTNVQSFIIAILGVIISASVAIYLTNRKIRAEIKLRRNDLTQAYSTSILNSRIESYKNIWFFLSEYAKNLGGFSIENDRNDACPVSELLEFYKNINAWDSKNALLLSKQSVYVMFNTRKDIAMLLRRYSHTKKDNIDHDDRFRLLKLIEQVEIALRIDIGIYEVAEFESRIFFKGYAEIEPGHQVDLQLVKQS